MASKGTPMDKLVLRRKQSDFASRLALMQIEAGRIELFATSHKIHEAVRMVGWEIAGDVTKYKQDKERSGL